MKNIKLTAGDLMMGSFFTEGQIPKRPKNVLLGFAPQWGAKFVRNRQNLLILVFSSTLGHHLEYLKLLKGNKFAPGRFKFSMF